MTNREFDEFFRRDYPLLVGFLVKLGFKREEAEEAAAEAMHQACKRWWVNDGPERIYSPHGWVRTAAIRIASRQVRRARQAPLPAEGANWAEFIYTDPDIAQINEENSALLRLLYKLPRKQRLVMAWHLDGFKDYEIAIQLDMELATVRSNLRHARDRLRQEYKPLYEQQDVRHTSSETGEGVVG